MTPQPIQAKVAVSTAVASPSETLVTGLDVAPAGASEPAGGDGQKHTWLYLEELANTLLANVQQLKALIEQAKSASGEAADVKGQEVRKEVRPRPEGPNESHHKECSATSCVFFCVPSQAASPEPDLISAAR